ncbi:MAG: CotH kinase family protein [Chitinophagales bacterium]
MKKIILLFTILPFAICLFSQEMLFSPNFKPQNYAAKMGVVVLDSSSLPLVYINTGLSDILDEPRIIADMGIICNPPGSYNHPDDPFNNYNGKINIEIRGSSSQGFPKKCYSLELQDAAGLEINSALLGMHADDDWILYGPYTDKSLLRDALAYHMGALQGWYSPDFKFCEVFLNDAYEGIYLMMEKIKVQKDRVDIDQMTTADNAGIDLTGGYIVKVDRNDYASPVTDFFYSEYEGNGWPYDVMYVYVDPKPELITTAQKNYIEDYIDDFEDAMNSADPGDMETGYHKYIDINSFVDFLIVNELSRNVDAYRLSTYFYKNNDSYGGKLFAGPLWDFNLTFGNADYCTAWTVTEFFTDCGTGPAWWGDLFNDADFQNRLYCRWNELRAGVFNTDSLKKWIDDQVVLLGDAVDRNYETWDILGEYVWPNYFIGNTYEDEINYLKLWLTGRLNWMDDNMPGDPGVCDIAGSYPVNITEVHYNSDNYNESNDWIELHNNSANPVDISNWVLKDETPFNSYTIPGGTIIDANAYLVIVEDIDTFLMVHPDVVNYIGPFNWGFDNTFGSVKLEDDLGGIVKQINYIDSIPWPKGADGLGPALQILNESGDENDPANWIASCVLGTPGEPYIPCDYQILVSELNYNSLLGYNTGDWLEILNRGTVAKDISGWILRDANTGNIFVIPGGNVLDPGERLVVADSLESFTVKFPSVTNVIGEPAFHFSNGGDGVRLYEPSGLIRYSLRYNDASPWPLDPDGTGFTLELVDEPGNPNIAASWIAGCLYGSPGTQLIIPCPDAVENFYPTYFTVSPNPFTEFIEINIDEGIDVSEIFITNSLGQKIITLDTKNNIVRWNGDDARGNMVSNGIYFISVIDEGGSVSSARLIKGE